MSRRQLLGVLAGGLALGVASAVTLATWQDPEAATATFTAGTFETQSQGAGGGWSHHGPGSAALLTAGLGDLAPGGTWEEPTAGESHHGSLAVRTVPGSTRGGLVWLEAVSADGALGDVLEYRVVVRDPSGSPCSEADFGSEALYLAGGPDAYASLGDGVGTASAEIGADGHVPVELCLDLRVAAPDQGDTGEAVQGTTSAVGVSVTVTQL